MPGICGLLECKFIKNEGLNTIYKKTPTYALI